MPVARILCGCTFNIEVYDELDSPEGRLAAEALSLAISIGNAQRPEPQRLNADPCEYVEQDGGVTRSRPVFVLPNVAPITYSLSFNSFRKSDEFECTIPAALLPVPPEAIRAITVYVVVRHLSADEWAQTELFNGSPAALLAPDLSNADFAGICHREGLSITADKQPTVKLNFHDFLGLLSSKKVPTGLALDPTLPLSKAIAKFLVGTPAEGLCVAWVDPDVEPSIDEHIPKAVKKPGKTAKLPATSNQSYLDVITEECSRLGCVARLRVARIEVSNAGPLYEGQVGTARSSLLVGSVVESIEAEHQLVGVKSQAVQVVGYNPDTGDLYTARWPPDPKKAKATVVEPGKPPRLPPVAANVGLPGYEQLDESILLIPVGMVASQERLLQVAQMIFLERTRQRIRYTIKTHAPWSNPLDPDVDGGDLLRLRAGDVVEFGYIAPADESGGELLPPAVRALTGVVGAQGVTALLEASGVAREVAERIGQVVTRVPRLSLFRVDELHIAGGAEDDAELTFRLVNFVQIVEDTQAAAQARDVAAAYQKLAASVAELAVATLDDVKAAMARAYDALAKGALAQEADVDALRGKIDQVFAQVMKGR